MTEEVRNTQKQNFKILTQCPTTGGQVWGNSLIHFSIRGNKAAWWCCPTCENWHILIFNGELEQSMEQPEKTMLQ